MYKRLIIFTLALILGALPALAQGDPPLPEVTPTANPDTIQTPRGDWNWAQFLEETDSFYTPPDPLSVTVPDVYQGDLPATPIDLSQVGNLEVASLNDAQQAMLAENGFVVVPGNHDFFHTPYRDRTGWDPMEGNGYWVTTDALLNALYVSFENLIIFLEMDDLATRVTDVSAAGYQAAYTAWQDAQGTELQSAAEGATLYYAVALGLLNPERYAETVQDETIRAAAQPLIDNALRGEGRLDVPFLAEYQEDFSQYKARGHYTATEMQSQYFRGMMWLGRITFLASDPAATQTGLLVLRALVESGQYNSWQAMSDLLAFLIGPEDNPGPAEYLPLARQTFGDDLPLDALAQADLVAQFQAGVQALPAPRIHNVVRPMGTESDELDSSTRGFRVFGQRFTFDGYALQRLIYPDVGTVGNERALPSGLDVAAVLGSDLAVTLMEERGMTDYENYRENLAMLREEVNQIAAQDWLQNIYGGWLWTLQPLWVRNAESYPPLMNTDAWQHRDLQAGLGSYTELKHSTLLYTVQPMGGLGGGGDTTVYSYSYVEPNPLVFSRVAIVATLVAQYLQSGQFIPEWELGGPPPGLFGVQRAFIGTAVLAAEIADMASRLLDGEQLTDDERFMLERHFGSRLWNIRYEAELAVDDPPDNVALVVDIASNPDAGTVLQQATGLVDTIYVVIDSPEGLRLTRGGVYTYYEFTGDIDNRLTDEEWESMLLSGEAPPRPDWISTFYSE